jgi:hypothetical protein
VATFGPEGQGLNRLAAEFIAGGCIDWHCRRRGNGGKFGQKGQGQGTEAEQCAKAPEPAGRADIFGQVWRPVEPGKPHFPVLAQQGKPLDERRQACTWRGWRRARGTGGDAQA